MEKITTTTKTTTTTTTTRTLLLVLTLCTLSTRALLSFQIEPKSEDCFYIDLQHGQAVGIPFYVTRGGLLDIDLRISGPNDEQIFSGIQYESSRFDFTARTGGQHKICWNNQMARWTAKVVQFDVEIAGTKSKGAEDSELLTPDKLDPVQQTVKRISTALDQIQADQKYLRVREQKHRDTAESTNTRVLWYSILESLVLVGISLGQVFYLRKFFEVKRAV